MQDYKPNSHRFKEEQKKVPVMSTESPGKKEVQKVVKGQVKEKKKGP